MGEKVNILAILLRISKLIKVAKSEVSWTIDNFVALRTINQQSCTITENAPTRARARAFSWLKASTSTFTFKTLYTKQMLTHSE